MIKEHTPYNINDAVYSIRTFVASKANQVEAKTNIPSFNSLLKDPYSYFKATVACLKLDLDDLMETKDRLLVYHTISSEVKKALAEDLDCFDAFIFGDYVFGIFYTPMKESMKRLIDSLAKINSTILLFRKISGISNFKYSIAADYGDVYFINHLDANGKVEEYNWCGKLFDHIEEIVGEYSSRTVKIGSLIYNNIPETYQKFFTIDIGAEYYSADIVNTAFSKWKEDNVITNNNQ